MIEYLRKWSINDTIRILTLTLDYTNCVGPVTTPEMNNKSCDTIVFNQVNQTAKNLDPLQPTGITKHKY